MLTDILRQKHKITSETSIRASLTARRGSTQSTSFISGDRSPKPSLKILSSGKISSSKNLTSRVREPNIIGGQRNAIEAFVLANRSGKDSIDFSKTFSRLPESNDTLIAE